MATTRTVRPESVENGQEKCPGFCYKGGKNASTWITYKTVRPESVENGQEKCPGFCYKGGKNASTWITYKRRRRGRPEGSKSVKSEIEQKPTLIGSSSYSKGDRDANFKPRTPPKRKRGRQTRSKSAKSKVEQKPLWVDTTNNNSSEGTASDRAVELKKKLRAEGPSFVKHMKPSHVDRVFWLGLPAVFCRKHLPDHDVSIVLEDEEGRTFHTNYKADKTALSGGWAGFAKQHHLKVGDALVFHLVRQARFKVYVLRENKLTTSGSDEGGELASKEARRGGIRSPGPDTDDDFAAAMKSFEDNFKVVVGDGTVEALPDGVLETYYGLCRARRAFLHGRQTSSPALAREMIVETTKIADGIRACDSGSLEDLRTWKKTLESLESRGMDVAFLRQRVDDLLGLIGAPPSASVEPEWFAYKQLKLIQADAVKQQRTIKSTVSRLKHTLKEIDAEMEEMVQASMNKKEQGYVHVAEITCASS